MSNFKNWLARSLALAIAPVAILLALTAALFLLTDLPTRFGLLPFQQPSQSEAHLDEHAGHSHDDHADHDHDHAGHEEGETLELSKQARASMQLETKPVAIGNFTEFVEVPAVIAAWPGKTHVSITSPLTGVVTGIGVSRGELVESGRLMFTLRLTQEDLVSAQEQFLNQLGQLEIERREISRLSEIAESGAIAGKTLIAREYERDKLLASLNAARQAMLLHGLTEQQIGEIERSRELVREVKVYVPDVHEDRSLHHDSENVTAKLSSFSEVQPASLRQPPQSNSQHPMHLSAEFLVSQLRVQRGQAVAAGESLAELSDYSELLIEGHAFQHDSDILREASRVPSTLSAVFETKGANVRVVQNLSVNYIGDEVGIDSRALPFYVAIRNEVERSEERNGRRYVSWLYKPGQRLKLRVPVASLEKVIVLPEDAVAEDGLEHYVFVENGDHFDRVPVEVLSRDARNVAISTESKLFPGQVVATTGAHQLQMELKNKSGGGIDPHAGHNH